jgi:exodeoxyribonuclease-3
LKLAAWNVNSLKVRLPHLLEWLARERPDAVCLQETKTEDANFPLDAIGQAGYSAVFSGQKTYNGVAILARDAPQAVEAGIPGYADEQRRVLSATVETCGWCARTYPMAKARNPTSIATSSTGWWHLTSGWTRN